MRITNYSIFRDWRGNWYQAYLCYGCLLALESSLQILSGCLSIAKTVMNSSFSFVWFLYFFFRTLWLWKTLSKQLQCNCHLLVAFVVVFVSKCNFLFMQMSPEHRCVSLGSPFGNEIDILFRDFMPICMPFVNWKLSKRYTNFVRRYMYVRYGKKEA